MERVCKLNRNITNKTGKYVLYWVQASPRTELNHALEFASTRANKLGKPVLACFVILSGQNFNQFGNERHYAFMIEGLLEMKESLRRERRITLLVALGPPPLVIKELSKEACEVVVDKGYLRVQRQWYKLVAESLTCPLIQVETNVVIPVEVCSDKEEFAARTIRSKLWKHAARFLKPLDKVPLENACLDINTSDADVNLVDISNIDKFLEASGVDRSVERVRDFPGGYTNARKCLSHFCAKKLPKYDQKRNIPGEDFQSHMSAFLHFGQISPVEIIISVKQSSAPSSCKDSYIEEVFIRRELSMNFVWYNPDAYDSIECLPGWAKETISRHKSDKRPYTYSENELERAQTHDIYWNACQLEMVHKGKMHGYMRMYWGKKVVEWMSKMEDAYKCLIRLNDTYELDGRDPNGYAGIAWCFGKHDRAHAEREVFGKIRYMSQGGLTRKYKKDLELYVTRCYKLAKRAPEDSEL